MLTIGIPSFERADSAAQTVRNLFFLNNYPEVKLVLINNGSSRTRYIEVQQELKSLVQSKYLEFQTNLGFAESFLRVIENCETEYLLFLSDEDYLIEEGFENLLNLLKETKPSFVSLRRLSTKKYKQLKKIKLSAIKGASSYVSGLIFQVDRSKSNLSLLRQLCDTEEFAKLYPQVVLAWIQASNGSAVTLNTPRYVLRDNLETTVSSSNGSPYWHPTERVYQYISSLACLQKIARGVNPTVKRRLTRIEKGVRSKFFGLLFDSVKTISPEILPDLAKSTFKTSLIFEIRFLIRRILGNSK